MNRLPALLIGVWLCLSGLTPLAWAAEPPAGPAGRLEVPPGWRVHQGSQGLVVLLPLGWQVRESGQGAFLALAPGPGQSGAQALALVQPVQEHTPAPGLLQNMGRAFPQVFPQLRVSRIQALSQQPQVASARLDYLVNGQPYQGLALAVQDNGRGMIYAAAATGQAWPSLGPQALGVLKSFLYADASGQAGQASAPGLPAMRLFSDPLEGAFTCQVPQGWRVEGGLKRFHAVDARPELLAQSPDGGVLVRIGDAQVPSMALPNAMLSRTGFHEGSTYDSGYGLKQMVMRYLPGSQFAAQWYLPRRVGQVSQVRENQLAELTRQVQAGYAATGLPIRADLGEVFFVKPGPQGEQRGYVFVKTLLVSAPGGNQVGTWQAEMICGYLAKPDQEPLAQALFNAMVQSFRMDPAWLARQSRTAGQVSAIVAQTHEQISSMIHQAFQNRQRIMDRTMDRYVRGAIRGTVLVEDPNTRTRLEVPGGSNYYWRGGDGAVVGTQTDDRPYHPNQWLERLKVLD